MTIRCTPLAVLVVAVAAGCSSGTEAVTTLWEGPLQAVLPATVTGSVAALTDAGRTRVTIEIRDAIPGQSYGWSVTEGTCAAPGALQGGAALYPSLAPDPSGAAGAEASLPAIFESGGRYAARVVRTEGAGGDQVVSCGDLQEVS